MSEYASLLWSLGLMVVGAAATFGFTAWLSEREPLPKNEQEPTEPRPCPAAAALDTAFMAAINAAEERRAARRAEQQQQGADQTGTPAAAVAAFQAIKTPKNIEVNA